MTLTQLGCLFSACFAPSEPEGSPGSAEPPQRPAWPGAEWRGAVTTGTLGAAALLRPSLVCPALAALRSAWSFVGRAGAVPGSLCRFVSNASRERSCVWEAASASPARTQRGCVSRLVKGVGGPEGRSGVSLRGWRSKKGASVVWENTQWALGLNSLDGRKKQPGREGKRVKCELCFSVYSEGCHCVCMDLEVKGIAASPRRQTQLLSRGKKCQVC